MTTWPPWSMIIFAVAAPKPDAPPVTTATLPEISMPLPPSFEEALYQLHALGRQHAFHNFHAMIQKLGIGQMEFAAHAAETQIASAKDQAVDPRGHQRSGA